MYDMFIGGVSGTLEPVATTALRELGEELGLGPYGGGGGGGGGPNRGTLGLSCRSSVESSFCVCRGCNGDRRKLLARCAFKVAISTG